LRIFRLVRCSDIRS
jgi:tripeptidyl-peptidase-1